MELSGVDVVCFQLAGTAARVLRAGRAQLCEFVQRDCAANAEAGAAEAELSGGHLVVAQRATARARGGALLPRAAAAEPAVAIASVGRARDAGGARASRLLRQGAAPALGALRGAARQRVCRAQPHSELHACRSAPRELVGSGAQISRRASSSVRVGRWRSAAEAATQRTRSECGWPEHLSTIGRKANECDCGLLDGCRTCGGIDGATVCRFGLGLCLWLGFWRVVEGSVAGQQPLTPALPSDLHRGRTHGAPAAASLRQLLEAENSADDINVPCPLSQPDSNGEAPDTEQTDRYEDSSF